MKRMLLLITVLISFSCAIGAQENDDVSLMVRIAEIKMDSNYYYGDATMENREDAETFARLLLSDVLEENDLPLDLKQGDVKIMSHKRGSMWRVFAYICKDSLGAVSRNPFAGDDHARVALLEELLRSAVTLTSLSHELDKESTLSGVIMGRVDNNTDSGLIERSYIIVGDSKNDRIKYVLTPPDSERKRTDVKTGEKQSSINYKRGDIVSWVHL